VTFLFTDIEGSTRLWESAQDAMRAALEAHDSILRGAIEENGGYIFATGGDGFAVAFARAGDALSAATAAQALLAPSRGRKRRCSACAWACTPEKCPSARATTSARR
jgi:class 3 adenylate cyclase